MNADKPVPSYKPLLARQENMYFEFINLMPDRVRNILIVASIYDSFMLSQDGQLGDLIMDEFATMNIAFIPMIYRVSSGDEALEMLKEGESYDLILTSYRVGDIEVGEFAAKVKEIDPHLPVILLAFENREVQAMQQLPQNTAIDKVFLWQGNSRILFAIVKYIEDMKNIEHDTELVGVQVLIMVEDNMSFYSSYLPMIYTELIRHSQRLMDEGLNIAHRIMRMRTRPKILLFDNYEDAWEAFSRYKKFVFGVISDVEFMKDGVKNPDAGAIFVNNVRKELPDMPVLMQSFQSEYKKFAEEKKISFIRKDSSRILDKLRHFLVHSLGFGDFVFRLPDGKEVDRAKDLMELEQKLQEVPGESIKYHAELNHFSKWLKTRAEFALAVQLRPRKVSDYENIEALRSHLINSLQGIRRDRSSGTIIDYNSKVFDISSSFARIGGGSLGGKARGLAFIKHLLHKSGIADSFNRTEINIPATVVCCTDIYDKFIEKNNLLDFALNTNDKEKLQEKFVQSEFPEEYLDDFRSLLSMYELPLAVRSSSLLEDSHYQPFAGVYETYMVTNNNEDIEVRLHELLQAIKLVYASVFTKTARALIKSTPYRIEEEKMAIIIQTVVGNVHGTRFYPEISGVARSYNFYAKDPMKPEDGIASVAFGLGMTVVDGGNTVRFSPKFPRHSLSFNTTDDYLRYSQRKFYAIDLNRKIKNWEDIIKVENDTIDTAEADHTLYQVASVYSFENDAIYDGISRPGTKLITFAPILKQDTFELANIIDTMLKIGEEGVGGPVEIEFAVNLPSPGSKKYSFSLLQIRPMVLSHEDETISIDDIDPEQIICDSQMALGTGQIDDIKDIVYVNPSKMDRSKSMQVAMEVEKINNKLNMQDKPYLLIGVGRWGSSDPWLGIPVSWDQISGARTIVETGFKDIRVEPSQGAHFFHNLMSLNIGYFTINPNSKDSSIDWEWLKDQKISENLEYVKHVSLDKPLLIKLEGHNKRGVICKPFV